MILLASQAHIWTRCPGMPGLQGQIVPVVQNDEKRIAGIEAHKRAHKVLTGESQECADDIRPYIDSVTGVTGFDDSGYEMKIRCHILSSNAIVDAWKYVPGEKKLIVWDYKHGDYPVEAIGNPQGIIYMDALTDMITEPIDVFEFRVVQPRAWHKDGIERIWTLSGEELDRNVDEIRNAARRASDDRAQCKPSPICKLCLARYGCRALQECVALAIDYSAPQRPQDLDIESASVEWLMICDAIKVMKARMDAMEGIILYKSSQGERSRYTTVVRGRGQTVWTKPPEEIAAVAAVAGVDISKPLQVITPKQAEAAGLSPSILGAFSEVRPGKLKVDEIKNVIRSYQ